MMLMVTTATMMTFERPYYQRWIFFRDTANFVMIYFGTIVGSVRRPSRVDTMLGADFGSAAV